MPSFNSRHPSAPEPVDFDLTEFGVDAQGIIPEPSGQQLLEFDETMRAIVEETYLDEDNKPRVLTKEEVLDRSARVNVAVAALCSDTPTAEQIGALPSAPRGAFIDFVQECFLNPGARAVGTSGSRPAGGDFGMSSAETSATA